MNSNIIHGLIYLSVAVVSYFIWRKYRDRDYLWFAGIGLFAVLINAADFALKNISQIPIEIKFISSLSFLLFDPIIVILVLRILFKSNKK